MSNGGKAAMSIDYGSRQGNLQAMLGATLHVVSADFEMFTFVVGCTNSPGRHQQTQVRAALEELLVKLKLSWDNIIGLMHDAGGNMDVSVYLRALDSLPVYPPASCRLFLTSTTSSTCTACCTPS